MDSIVVKTNVIKRNGREVHFDEAKITNAIEKANKEVDPIHQLNHAQVQAVADSIAKQVAESSHAVNVEDIQDMVEKGIMEMRCYEVAQKYVRYRYKRELSRKSNTTDNGILALIDQVNEEVKQENSNKNPVINSTQRDYMAGEVSKDLTNRVLLPEDIVKLGVEGVNRIWRDAKLRGAGMKRAKTLIEAAEHSIGSREAQEAARVELKILLADYEMQTAREAELMALIEEKITEVPYVDKLLEIRGVGLKTVVGFVAEVGDITRFDDPKQLQKLAGYAIVKNESGKHKGESHISYRGRKRLRYVLYEAAVSVVSHSPEFRSIHQYYTTREKNPLKKMQSMIAVACKLIRVFYLILQTGTTYDAAKLMGDIRRPVAA